MIANQRDQYEAEGHQDTATGGSSRAAISSVFLKYVAVATLL